MIAFNRRTRVFACITPVNMTFSYDRLYGLVRDQLREDPLSGHIFLFVNRSRTLCKAIHWDGTGLVILSKRLEVGQFSRFNERLGRVEMTTAELALFFEGADLTKRFIDSPQEFVMKTRRAVEKRITSDEFCAELAVDP